MDQTISIDAVTLASAEALARRRGLTVPELLRHLLQAALSQLDRAAVAPELLALLRDRPGDSGGRTWTRNDAYGDRF